MSGFIEEYLMYIPYALINVIFFNILMLKNKSEGQVLIPTRQILMIFITASFVEESFFRYYINEHILFYFVDVSFFNIKIIYIINAIIFGIAHFSNMYIEHFVSNNYKTNIKYKIIYCITFGYILNLPTNLNVSIALHFTINIFSTYFVYFYNKLMTHKDKKYIKKSNT